MRTLTIKRNKAFAGWATKDKVYIEDYVNNDIIINKVPCRKIGTLKNGEEKTFDIDPIETKVYIISDKLSRNMSNDFYKIPAGEENLTISGEHRYNPFNGNAFRFDGIADEEVLANRKKTSRKAAIFLSIIFVLAFVVSFALSFFAEIDVMPEPFNYSNMTITLTNEFTERNIEGYSACYESYDTLVMIIKDDSSYFEDFEAYTLEQYGEDTLEYNEFDSSIELKEENDLTYFEYEFVDGDDTFSYFVPLYKSSDAFWFFQFACYKEDYESNREQFIEWAKSVEFTG